MSPVMSSLGYGLLLLKIPVGDVARAAAFYRDVLGFSEEFVAEAFGWAQFSAGELLLAIYVPGMGGGDGHVGGSTGFHLTLGESEFAALAERLLARGALVEDRIHRGNDGTTFIEVRDPDGNTLKVFRTDSE